MICLYIIILYVRTILEGFVGLAEVLLEDNTALWEERPRNEKSMKGRKKCIKLLNTLFRPSAPEKSVEYNYTECTNLGHHAQI